MKAFTFVCATLSLTASLGSAQRSKPPAAVAVVRQLYADFACEAVVDEPGCDTQHEFVDQPHLVLAKYFDDRLTRLWLADRNCAARTHEVCRLDFSPIWDSQDPTGTYVRILATPDSAAVDVQVRHGPTSKKSILRYTLVKVPAGWRIHDIVRGKEWSLVALLSRKL